MAYSNIAYKSVYVDKKNIRQNKNIKIQVSQRSGLKHLRNMSLVFAITLFFAVITVAAISTKMSYSNSQLNDKNIELASEIQATKSTLNGKLNLENIKIAAETKLGMVNMEGAQYVYMKNEAKNVKGFADTLRASAFK
ncbi:MAG: hypothetical protein PUI85_04690 [Eubacteriales bacterium]|nr:hypothetical protein [Eubacteriales bacterium]MDY3332156.1 hypothetical protein [Gallibacter sp.]